MAKDVFHVKSTGLKEFIEEMNGLVEQLPEITKKAIEARQRVVENKIRSNWVSLVGGPTGGYVHSSVGQSSAFSKENPVDVVGTVGVYQIDSVTSQFQTQYKIGPKKGKDKVMMNAAQIAYWVEFGSSRLYSGERKVPGEEYNDEDLIHNVAKPFISNAFYSSIDEQEEVFKMTFNKLADRIK